MDGEIQAATTEAAPPEAVSAQNIAAPASAVQVPPVYPSAEVAAPPSEPPAAPEPMSAEDRAKHYEPIPIRPKISVTILVVSRFPPAIPGVPLMHLAKPANKTGFIHWHESVYHVLAKISEPTDGSLVMLMPGTSYPIYPFDSPYDYLKDGATVYVVPNTPDQVGPDAQAAP